MKKLLLSLTLAASLLGCTVTPNTPQNTEQTSELLFKAAVDTINLAYVEHLIPKDQHDQLKPYVDGANKALQQYHDDLAAGKLTELDRDLNAFHAFATEVVKQAGEVKTK